MKLLLTGGGTAGQVNPALAIAEIFRKNYPTAGIAFAGTPNGMERRLVAEAGLPYYPIEAMGLSRSLSLKNLRALHLALVGPRRAEALLRTIRPDLVVGTGGYVSWPVLKAATALKIPCAIHESNAVPGLTVRRLAGEVDAVLLNLAEAENALPRARHIVHVGNPLCGGFSSVSRDKARAALGIPEKAHLVVSFGGSLGAAAINRAVLTLWQEYTLHTEGVYHIHGCGTRYFEAFKKEAGQKFRSLPPRIGYSAYLGNMPLLMAAADLLICRAGAMTISEVARARRAAILIPSPNVAGDHQTKNALALTARGAGILLKEEALTDGVLSREVASLLHDDAARRRMEEAVGAVDIPDANRRILTALTALIKK